VKHLQKFASKSEEHRKHFGMRSLVESATPAQTVKNRRPVKYFYSTGLFARIS
jgi:hypothetical protein